MGFLKVTSPHAHRPLDTGTVMRHVIYATIPGVLALTYFFGWGNLVNILFACVCAVIAESIVLKLRKRPIQFYLKDYSVIVTAVLLGVALPPYAPWWLIVVGIFFAVIIGKQLYGGMGYNPFNPAMVAYVVLLISFPLQMTQWATPVSLLPDGVPALGVIDAIKHNFGIDSINFDAYTMATPLDLTFQQNDSMTMAEISAAYPQFGQFGGIGWEWVNLMFLLGGLYLLYKRIYTWHAPIAMLVSLSLLSIVFYQSGGSESGGSPMFQLFSGATMFGAFFIVTDPVTSAVSNRGKLIYGACIGLLVYVIRHWGNYPDAIAFAVLLMNFAAPLIDQYTQPRTYGHKKPKQGDKE